MKLDEMNLRPVDSKLLAEFVEEGLAGLGVLDDADELISFAFTEDGPDAARAMFVRYNNAIRFVNQNGGNLKLISEENYKRYTS